MQIEDASLETAGLPQAAPPGSRLLVLLFSDLVGSTSLKGEITTAGYVPLLRRHDEILRAAVASAGGTLQQDTGDGGFALFATPSDAVRAALLFQCAMQREAWPQDRRLHARVGIHLGEVAQTEFAQEGGAKLVGIAVDLAARIMSLAQGGQILLTRAAFDDARQFLSAHPADRKLLLKWVAHGPYLIKGCDDPVDVFEVGAEGQSPLAPPPDSEKARRAIRPGDEQTLGWRPAAGLELPGSPHWAVERKLGEGGFGEVWLARHFKTKAVRVFKFCFDPERLRSLKREVALFRLLREAVGDRRDIAPVKDWRFDEYPYFIEMEFAPCGNLTDWAAAQGGIRQIPLGQRLGIVAGVARALSAAHSVGILHKDIKPSNILMVEDAAGSFFPRLTDFGIGILTDRDRLKAYNVTAAGFTAPDLATNDSSRTGTRMYAPPESLSDRPHTVQGDVYALGVLLYQMCVGDLSRPLAVGWERDIADELLREDIAACVDGDPSRRLPAVAELAERLDGLEARRAQQQHQAEQARALVVARHRRRQVRILAGAVVALLVLSSGIGWLWHNAVAQRREADAQRAEAVAQRQRAQANETRAIASERDAASSAMEAKIELARSLVAQGDALMLAKNWGDAKARLSEATSVWRGLGADPIEADLAMFDAYKHSPPPLNSVAIPTGFAEKDPMVMAYYALAGRSSADSAGHLESVTTISSTSDGRLALAGVRHAPAALWDLKTGRLLRQFDARQGGEPATALTPDGRWAVTGGPLGRVTVWNAQTGERTASLQARQLMVYAVAIDQDAHHILCAGKSGFQHTVELWDVTNQKRIHMYENLEANRLSLAPDSRHALMRDNNHAYVLETDGKFDVTRSARGSDFGLMDASGKFVLIDNRLDQKKLVGLTDAEPVTAFHAAPGSSAGIISADGHLGLVSDGPLRLWELARGEEVRCFTDHTEMIVPSDIAVSHDGRVGVSGSWDTTVKLWPLKADTRLRSHETPGGRLCSAAFAFGGRAVLASPGSDKVELYDTGTSRTVLTREGLPGQVRAIAANLDGRAIAIGLDNGTIIAGPCAEVLKSSGAKSMTLAKHDGAIRALAFSPDGRLLASGGDDGTAKVWDAATGQLRWSIAAAPLHCLSVAFSPDGRALLTGGDSERSVNNDAQLALWDVSNGQKIRSYRSFPAAQVTFMPDGASFMASSAYGLMTRRSTADGQPLWPKTSRAGEHGVVVSPDGRCAASVEYGGVMLWDGLTGRKLRSWPSPIGGTTTFRALFSPDGRYLMIGANSGQFVVTTLLDLQWVPTLRSFDARLDQARSALANNPADGHALQTLAEWYAFRGFPDWAAELLDQARSSQAKISPLLLGQCLWQMAGDRRGPGGSFPDESRAKAAAKEFSAAMEESNDETEKNYLKLCIDALPSP